MAAERPPDVLIIILDCVRAQDFPGGSSEVTGMPFVSSFRRSSVSFPRAVAPSAWTIPSHASLFTGLYPWEHGDHLKSGLVLDEKLPTLATLLARQGYSTLSLSGNGFISPDFGLVNGFQSVGWAAWWERFARVFSSRQTPPCRSGAEFVPGSAPSGLPSNGVRSSDGLPRSLATVSNLFHPFLKDEDPIWLSIALNSLNRGVHLFTRPKEKYRLSLCPWTENVFRDWVHHQPRENPLFGFVNFLDAHEPYLTDPDAVSGWLDWWRYSVLRMDKTSMLAGQWVPTARDYVMLHKLYRDMIRGLDARIASLVTSLKEAGRWENTLMIVTSDHGQAFGEHGFLFHGYRLWESIVRVPLWVRYPNDAWGGKEGKGWASLIDVGPTVMEVAGSRWEGLPSAESLTGLIEGERGAPVMTMADGVHVRRVLARLCPPERVAYWDSPWMAGYEGDRKLLIDMGKDELTAYELGKDLAEQTNVIREVGGELGALEGRLREAGRQLLSRGTGETSKSVEDRLRSWGYC